MQMDWDLTLRSIQNRESTFSFAAWEVRSADHLSQLRRRAELGTSFLRRRFAVLSPRFAVCWSTRFGLYVPRGGSSWPERERRSWSSGECAFFALYALYPANAFS